MFLFFSGLPEETQEDGLGRCQENYPRIARFEGTQDMKVH